MRLSNRNKHARYHFYMTFLSMAFLFGIIAFFVERLKFNILGSESAIFIIIPASLLAIFYVRGRQIFEYDSDGEALNFKNRNVLLYNNKPVSDEFPKYKLINYEVVNAVLFKRLYVTVSSKKEHHVILKYDISYLTKKQLNDLKLSLNKVVKRNQELKRDPNS